MLDGMMDGWIDMNIVTVSDVVTKLMNLQLIFNIILTYRLIVVKSIFTVITVNNQLPYDITYLLLLDMS
jgi:hypothetical protein